jgi:hypothetical protein
MIESYRFGRMTIGGKTYTSDLVVSRDRIIPDWWRKSGHQLSLEDIQEILRFEPETLVVGTGAMGVLKVQPEVIEHLQTQGIELIVENTKIAVQVFNRLVSRKNVFGAFHLTC